MGEVRVHLPALSLQMTAINSTECLAQNACEHQGNRNIKTTLESHCAHLQEEMEGK